MVCRGESRIRRRSGNKADTTKKKVICHIDPFGGTFAFTVIYNVFISPLEFIFKDMVK